MSQIIRSTIVVILLLGSASELAAATPAEFYGTLLRRGVGEFDAGRFAEATRYLRLAAFGFVDSVDQYQTAQTYLAVAYDRLGDADRARDAAMRILRAERVARRFAGLTLPPAVRAQFDRIAPRLLNAADLAALRGTEPLPPLPSQAATTRVATQTGSPAQTTPVVVDRVDVEVQRPTATPATSTATTTPAQPAATRTPDPAVSGTNGSTRPATTQPRSTNPPAQQPDTTATTQRPTPATAQPATTPSATQPATTDTPRAATTQPTTRPATAETPRPATTTAATTTQTGAVPSAQQPATPARPTPTTTTTPQRPVSFTASQTASRLAAAERALATSNLVEARRIYAELLGSATLDHATAISIAEGLYRSRDFAGALGAFRRAGALRRGEEPYRYYIAVALYETGRYTEARRELAAALPHIEITPDVARYRSKIESAVE